MQIDALKVFIEVVRKGSFTEAAKARDLSQSAVSQIVKQLEGRLGVQLINRYKQPVRPTKLGQTYYKGCEQLLEKFEELEASIRHANAQLPVHIGVAAIYSVGLGDMGQYVERFRALQPNAEIHIDYLHPDRVYERVLEGTADFGLVSFPRPSRELKALPWREEEMVLACSPLHPLARDGSIKPEHLMGLKYVGFDKDLVIRKEVDKFLSEHGVTVEVAMTFDNIENIKKAVEEAAGVALLPKPTLRREVEAGTLVAVPLSGWQLVRPLGIIERRRHKLNAAAQRFLDLLRQPLDRVSVDAEANQAVNGAPHGRNGAASRRKNKK